MPAQEEEESYPFPLTLKQKAKQSELSGTPTGALTPTGAITPTMINGNGAA